MGGSNAPLSRCLLMIRCVPNSVGSTTLTLSRPCLGARRILDESICKSRCLKGAHEEEKNTYFHNFSFASSFFCSFTIIFRWLLVEVTYGDIREFTFPKAGDHNMKKVHLNY